MILEVVQKAMEVGLDLLTLPSHTTHRLQPLVVSIFALFNCTFKRYKDAWVLKKRGKGASKYILAMWVSMGLQRALTTSNIEGGFRTCGVWPLNPRVVDQYLGLSKPFTQSITAAKNGTKYEASEEDNEGAGGSAEM